MVPHRDCATTEKRRKRSLGIREKDWNSTVVVSSRKKRRPDPAGRKRVLAKS